MCLLHVPCHSACAALKCTHDTLYTKWPSQFETGQMTECGTGAQVGSPEVVSGIARRALSVIHEAAQATQTHSHTGSHGGSEARAVSHLGAGSTRGGSSFVYPQATSQGVSRQDTKVQLTLHVSLGPPAHTLNRNVLNTAGQNLKSKYCRHAVSNGRC